MENKNILLWEILGPERLTGKSIYLLVKCKCGLEKWVRKNSIGRDSFGCRKCRNGQRRHGDTKTRLYHIWSGMKQRCYYKKSISYKSYGAKGIEIYEPWRKRFAEFKKWAIANGYDDSKTIDRIDNLKDYEPSNCRWVSQAEQNRNQISNIFFELHGKRMILKDWANLVGANYDMVRNRIYSGWDIDRALFTDSRAS